LFIAGERSDILARKACYPFGQHHESQPQARQLTALAF